LICHRDGYEWWHRSIARETGYFGYIDFPVAKTPMGRIQPLEAAAYSPPIDIDSLVDCSHQLMENLSDPRRKGSLWELRGEYRVRALLTFVCEDSATAGRLAAAGESSGGIYAAIHAAAMRHLEAA